MSSATGKEGMTVTAAHRWLPAFTLPPPQAAHPLQGRIRHEYDRTRPMSSSIERVLSDVGRMVRGDFIKEQK